MQKEKKSLWVKRIGWILITLAIIGGVVWLVVWYRSQPTPGEAKADEGRKHIPTSEPLPTYNSNPPTSGSHYGLVPPYGIYDQYLSPGYQIHLLEHGGIIIHYKSDDQKLIDDLRELTRDLARKNPRVVLMPNPEIDSLLAVTAWNQVDHLEALDTERIRQFFRAHINKGPEKVGSTVMQPPTDIAPPIELFE